MAWVSCLDSFCLHLLKCQKRKYITTLKSEEWVQYKKMDLSFLSGGREGGGEQDGGRKEMIDEEWEKRWHHRFCRRSIWCTRSHALSLIGHPGHTFTQDDASVSDSTTRTTEAMKVFPVRPAFIISKIKFYKHLHLEHGSMVSCVYLMSVLFDPAYFWNSFFALF